MEEAVLGPRDSDDESYDSEPSTRVTDFTDDDHRDAAKKRFGRDRGHAEEKKSSDSISLSVSSTMECLVLAIQLLGVTNAFYLFPRTYV